MAETNGDQIGSLFWGMDLDLSEFKKKAKSAEGRMKKFGSNVTDQFKTIAKNGAIIAGAFTAAGAGILLFTENSLEAVNAQILLADSIGVTQGDVAALELSATKLGVSQDMLIDKMREFGGLDEFNKIADQVKNAGDESAQLAKAQELLGNEGLKLLPILQQGAEGFAAMKREAGELGLALSPVQIEESRVAWEQYETTILSIKGLGAQLAQSFLKPLGLVSAGVEGFIKTFKNDIIAGFTFVSNGMTNLIMGAINLFTRFGIPFINGFILFANQIGSAFETLFNFLSPATEGALSGLGAMFNTVTDFIATFKQSMIIGITKPIEGVVRGAFGLLSKLARGLRDTLAPILFGLVEIGAISDKTAKNVVSTLGSISTDLHLQGLKIAKPFADAQREAEKEMVNILTDKFKKDQSQQLKFKGIIGEFTTNFGKALENAAAVPAKVVSAALKASVSDKFAGLALSGSQEEANLLSAGKKNEQVQKDQLKKLDAIAKGINKIGVV